MARSVLVGRSDSRNAALAVPTDLSTEGVQEIGVELRQLLADVFTLYVKTKNYHWHVTGPHYREYHLLLDEQADQLFAMTDALAERARKLGTVAVRSIGEIARLQRLKDDPREFVAPEGMLSELRQDSLALTRYLRSAHEICEKHRDVGTTSLIEVWLDETERRTWFLSSTLAGASG